MNVNGLDLTAGAGIALQLLKIGDLLLTSEQKRRAQYTVEIVTLRLAYLEPLQWLRRLNTSRGRAALALVSAAELALEQLKRQQYVIASVIFVAGAGVIFLAFRIGLFSRALDKTLNYVLEPLIPCFEGVPGRLQSGLVKFQRRTTAIGAGSMMIGAFAGFGFNSAFQLGPVAVLVLLPFAVFCFFLILLLLPVLNTLLILDMTLAATFMLEFMVKFLRALAWRVIEYSGGAHGAIFLLLTAAVTIWAIVLRIKN